MELVYSFQGSEEGKVNVWTIMLPNIGAIMIKDDIFI
jgi:hypothetical protein